MSQLPGTVIAAEITTGDTINTFATGDQNLTRGGQHSVATLADRDAITTERRTEGMTCWVVATNRAYRLVGGITNSNWEDVVAEGPTSALALQIATEGTNTGTYAIDLANLALTIATVGTNTGTYALNTANDATAIAGAAYSLAMLGTIPPPLSTLPDVSIPSPLVNQVLAYNGSVWISTDSPSTVAPSAFTYFLEDIASGTAGYSSLKPVPQGVPEDVDTALVSSTSTLIPIDSYISDALNRTIIDAGVWEFSTYAAVDTGSAYVIVDLFLRTNAGVESYLFSGTVGPYTSSVAQLLSPLAVHGSYAATLTDKVVAKFYGSTATPPVNVSLFHSGTAHASHIHTPLGFGHNDLRGLQGGTTDQYYHVTLDQNNALAGTDGYPDTSNKYVTNSDPRLSSGQQQANLALQIASVGTNTGTAAYNLAELAYTLATAPFADAGNRLISGGNAIWVDGYTFAVEPTVVDFSGTQVHYPQTFAYLDPADSLNDRIDLIVADVSGTIIKVTGTASSPPALPDYDPLTQLQLTFIPVDANTTEYQHVTRTWMYREHLEWTYADNTVNLNPDSTADPYQGTKAIEGTTVGNNNYFQLTAPTQFNLSAYDTLYLYVKPKAAWGTRYLRFHWQPTATGARVGQYFSLNEGALGFQTSNNSYQLVAIPLRLFAVPVGTLVQTLRVTALSTAGTFGFFIDDMAIQVGVTQPVTAVPDATTTIKGIVELAENGETGSLVAVQGNDYRLALALTGTDAAQYAQSLASAGTLIAHEALGIASVGTNTGTYALNVANLALTIASEGTNTGTAALNLGTAAYNLAFTANVYAGNAYSIAVNGTNAVVVEQGTRSQADAALDSRIHALESTVGLGWSGTSAIYVTTVRNAPAYTKVTIINGVVQGQVDTTYAIQTFDAYAVGSIATLAGPTAWAGAGAVIPDSYGTGIGGTESYAEYTLGTVSTSVLYGSYTSGGWGGLGVIHGNEIGIYGSETFEMYAPGTYAGTATGSITPMPAFNEPSLWGGSWYLVQY